MQNEDRQYQADTAVQTTGWGEGSVCCDEEMKNPATTGVLEQW
jgi:hypothetical protein